MRSSAQEGIVAAQTDLRGSRFACLLVYVYAFSMALMQPAVPLLGFAAVPGDFIFLVLATICVVLLMQRQTTIVLDSGYYFIGAYFLAMLASASARELLSDSAAKLLTQLYLVSIPLVVCNLVRDEATLRRTVRWWLAGTAVVAAVGAASLIAFVLDADSPLFDYTRFHFGTLPPGDYPRLRLTFLNANLACNYLTVSMMLLLAAHRVGWVSKLTFLLLLAGILLSAASTISPGLGGIALAGGLWMWLALHDRRVNIARLFLTGGVVLALLFVAAMAVTPILHPTAPFLISVPGLQAPLAPAGRLIIWIDAARNFLEAPLLGRGIGSDAVMVRYQDPSGNLQELTDAHNMFLNVAVQCGLVGLAALLALIGHILRRTVPLRLPNNVAGVFRIAIGLGLLNGLVYQGLGGSFEDARHLWFALGLLLASSRLEWQATKVS